MHGHHFGLCLINFSISFDTPNTGKLQRITHLSQQLVSWNSHYQNLKKKIKIRKYYVRYYKH